MYVSEVNVKNKLNTICYSYWCFRKFGSSFSAPFSTPSYSHRFYATNTTSSIKGGVDCSPLLFSRLNQTTGIKINIFFTYFHQQRGNTERNTKWANINIYCGLNSSKIYVTLIQPVAWPIRSQCNLSLPPENIIRSFQGIEKGCIRNEWVK